MTIIGLNAFETNYIWVLPFADGTHFACVDPGDATPVLAYAQQQGLKLSHVLLTHHHPDHSAGIAELLAAYPQLTIAGPDDPRAPLVNQVVQEGDCLAINPDISFQVLFTPGHTSSHLCFYEPKQGWLFCGDTLFSAGCGRVFDGSMPQLHDSLQRLKQLPAATKVYCGHEYTADNLRFAATVEPNNRVALSLAKTLPIPSLPSTIGLERDINVFFKTEEPTVQQWARHQGLKALDSLTVFTALREAKNRFQ